MLPQRLQDAERPAKALTHEPTGIDWSLGVGEAQIFIFHPITQLQQGHGKVGIFGYSVGVEATRFAYRRDPPGANRSRHDADRAHCVQGTAFKVLASDVLQRLPARPKIDTVADLRVTGNGTNLG